VNLFTCRHFEISSFLEFNSFSGWSNVAISNFSLRQSEHFSEARLNGGHLRTVFQVIFGARFFRFNLQISLESSVSFSYFSLAKDDLWLAYRFLNLGSANPM